MTTTVPSIEARPFTERRDLLLEGVRAGDTSVIDEVLRGFGDLVAEAVSARDIAAIAGLRGQVGRLLRRVSREPWSEHAAVADVGLRVLDIVLDRGRTGALSHAAAEERERGADVLRDRVAALLAAQPRRPRDVADQLGCDPTQVSRALRELQEAGRVERVEPPEDVSDRRAHWYAAAASEQAAAV